jgi:hypothetical protein
VKAYPKIYGPYKRATEGPDRNKVIPGAWSRPEFETLAQTPWTWTEKVDGTNIRVHWDGHAVEFGGRTDNAQIPAKLIAVLRTLFPEELFEQQFGGTGVTIYGEGHGAGIQKGGGRYNRDGADFVMFDVLIGDIWLRRADVDDISSKMGIGLAPEVFTGTVPEAIHRVRSGLLSAWDTDGTFIAEGLVGVPVAGLLDRTGERIMMKVKTADFPPGTP